MNNIARNFTFALLIVGFVITLFTMVHAVGGFNSIFSLASMGLVLWVMVPYLVLFFSTRMRTSSKVSWVVLGSTLVIVGLGVFIYVDTYFVHTDHLNSTSGLIFIFVPLYQLILGCLMFFVSMFLNRPVKNNHESKTTYPLFRAVLFLVLFLSLFLVGSFFIH